MGFGESLLWTVGSGAVVSLLLTPLAAVLAGRLGVVDRPGAIKLQERPVALLGGVAILVAGLVGWIIASSSGVAPGAEQLSDRSLLLLGFLVVIGTGLIDDLLKERFPVVLKLLLQIAAVALVLIDLGPSLSEGGPWVTALAGLWLLTVLNAFNFVDNMNGQSAGLFVLSALACFMFLTGREMSMWMQILPGPATDLGLLAGCLAGAFLGFLPYNFPRARIYLGDTGSHIAGLASGVLVLSTVLDLPTGRTAPELIQFIPACLLVGVPLFDLLFSITTRMIEGRPIHHGDTRHLAHRLVQLGARRALAVPVLWILHLALILMGIWTIRMDEAGRWLALFAVVLLLGVAGWLLARLAPSD